MARKLDVDKLRYFREYDFTPEEMARYLNATPEAVRRALEELNAPSPAEVAKQKRIEAAKTAAGLRPRPPESLFFCAEDEEAPRPRFVPAPDLRDWLFATYLVEGAPIFRENCLHLLDADIGCLWTNVANSRGGKQIIGQAEKPFAQGNKWSKGRAAFQLWEWFHTDVDFLLTFDAQYAATCDDWQWCALTLHELLHCGQAQDIWGMPRFSKETGKPIYASRGHDLEEFEDVARLFGARAAYAEGFLQACLDGPELEQVTIDGACGTCGK